MQIIEMLSEKQLPSNARDRIGPMMECLNGSENVDHLLKRVNIQSSINPFRYLFEMVTNIITSVTEFFREMNLTINLMD